MSFPKDFLWGASTAAYQIEGAAALDGKGPSVWDMFSHWPGKVYRGHTGDVACDHYHLFREDVGLMRDLGLGAYRFSFSWPRLIPEGVGRVNEQGVAFYDALIDALLEAGITPWATLYHWDLPLALHRRGGWINPDVQHWFADYAALIADRFSDRVGHFFTLNEPTVFMSFGYWDGTHAPGLKYGPTDMLRGIHNVLLAHGRAVQVLRTRGKQAVQVGAAPAGILGIPVTETPENIEAARRATFATSPIGRPCPIWKEERPYWSFAWYTDPMFLGHYPEDGLELFAPWMPEIGRDDMATINQPLDFFGVNTYFGARIKAGPDGEPVNVGYPPGNPQNAFGWDIHPDCLYWAGRFYSERYGRPVYITENGIPVVDWVTPDGQVHDPARQDYLRGCIGGIKRGVAEGVPFKGYFHWSLLDNFEWAAGYRMRFGLIHVDYETQKRTPKDSARWYANVIRTNGESL